MDTTSPEMRARERAKALTDLYWHIGAYVIVNAFLWVLDAITDHRITWAYWTTIPWGLGLAFHFLTWMIQGRQLERRAAEKYLQEDAEHRRELDHSDR